MNVEKTKYMLLCHHQNVVQNRDIKIANRSFENVLQFIYLGMTVTNQKLIHTPVEQALVVTAIICYLLKVTPNVAICYVLYKEQCALYYDSLYLFVLVICKHVM
jgi:hypothetical protein